MAYPGASKPPDYSVKTAVKTVGLMTAVGLLLIGCVVGVTSLASGSDEDPGGEVTASAVPATSPSTPATVATTPATPSASPTSAPSTSAPTSAKPPAPRKPPAAPRSTRPPAPPPEDEPDDAYYANCTEARRAGAAPLYRGDPGYRKGLDRDGDGVACE